MIRRLKRRRVIYLIIYMILTYNIVIGFYVLSSKRTLIDYQRVKGHFRLCIQSYSVIQRDENLINNRHNINIIARRCIDKSY